MDGHSGWQWPRVEFRCSERIANGKLPSWRFSAAWLWLVISVGLVVNPLLGCAARTGSDIDLVSSSDSDSSDDFSVVDLGSSEVVGATNSFASAPDSECEPPGMGGGLADNLVGSGRGLLDTRVGPKTAEALFPAELPVDRLEGSPLEPFTPRPLDEQVTGDAAPLPLAIARDGLPGLSGSGQRGGQPVEADEYPLGPPPELPRVDSKKFSTELVYYATDRARTGRSHAAEFYGNKRGDLEYGACLVSIPYSHQPGEIEGPGFGGKADPQKHILLLDPITPLETLPFINALRDKIGQSTEREAIIFIHGYNVSFEQAVRRTAQLSYDLNFRGAAISYTWPAGNHGNYNVDWTNAEWTTPHCVQFLKMIARASGAEKIHLIAHSMGSRVLTMSLKELMSDPATRRLAPLFSQVVLAAPDIDAEVFKNQIAPAIRSASERLTIYTSKADKALELSARVNGYERLGLGGTVLAELAKQGWVQTVDASKLFDHSWLGVGHAYYGDSPILIRDLRRVLRGDAPVARGLIPASHGEFIIQE
jgi:esterase/lipase superfamily enzyme